MTLPATETAGQRPYLERTTGFEPATPTLAKKGRLVRPPPFARVHPGRSPHRERSRGQQRIRANGGELLARIGSRLEGLELEDQHETISTPSRVRGELTPAAYRWNRTGHANSIRDSPAYRTFSQTPKQAHRNGGPGPHVCRLPSSARSDPEYLRLDKPDPLQPWSGPEAIEDGTGFRQERFGPFGA